MWLGLVAADVAPSPNDHDQDEIVPSGSLDPEPVKLTGSGAAPVVGVAEITALGARLPATPEILKHVIRAS